MISSGTIRSRIKTCLRHAKGAVEQQPATPFARDYKGFLRFSEKSQNVLISEFYKKHVLCAEKVRRGKASRKSYGNNSRKEENIAVSKQDERMTSRGVSLEDYKWELYTEKAKKHGFKTRNDFIRAGVEFYLQWLERGDSETFLTPALEQVITAKLRDSENRISRMMFKLAVEQNFLAHLLASTTELEDYQVKKLYQDAIDEVRATNGNLSVTDTFRN